MCISQCALQPEYELKLCLFLLLKVKYVSTTTKRDHKKKKKYVLSSSFAYIISIPIGLFIAIDG